LTQLKKTLIEAEKIISQEKKLFTDEEIVENLALLFPEFPKKKILNFLKASAKIKKNKFGKWGMKHWPEVTPKGTREKVHLILKEHKKSMHFTQIADLIDKFELGKRKAHPQTVHNELIKDERFVLIGRGIYALKEWGYSEGTIQEVIKNILQEKKRPLKKEEIIKEVLKIRKVKKTTISINLNNSGVFERVDETYTIK
jgi:DNA-directed RNA polymerase delta subunit